MLPSGTATTGAVWGNKPVMGQPIYAQLLADYLENTYKPYRLTAGLTTIYIDSLNGSDVTGLGTVSFPFQTILRAKQMIATLNVSTVTLSLAYANGTPYTMPNIWIGDVNVIVVGTTSIAETRNITSITSAGLSTGVVIGIDGSTLTDNQWENRILSVTGALSNNRSLIVGENIGNTLTTIMHRNDNTLNDAQSNPTTSGDVNLLNLPEIQCSGTIAMLGTFQLNFRYVKLTGSTSDFFCNVTDKVEFRYCEVYVRSVTAGRSGGFYFTSSSIALYGGTNGVIQAVNGGDFRSGWGTVITNKNATANNNWWNIQLAGRMVWEGITYIRHMNTNAIRMDGAYSFVLTTSGSNNRVFFANAAGSPSIATTPFKLNSLGLFGGGVYGLPQCTGSITATTYINASLGANVVANSSSTVTTTHATYNTNTVSADGGATVCAIGSDNTEIRGGIPALPTFKKGGLMHVDTTNVGNIGAGEDNLMTFTLPAATLAIDNDYLEIEAYGSMTGNFTFTLYFGATPLITHTFTGGGANDFSVKARVYRTGATTQEAIATFSHGDAPTVVTGSAPAETLANAITIKGTGTGVANNDVIQKMMSIKWYPAIT